MTHRARPSVASAGEPREPIDSIEDTRAGDKRRRKLLRELIDERSTAEEDARMSGRTPDQLASDERWLRGLLRRAGLPDWRTMPVEFAVVPVADLNDYHGHHTTTPPHHSKDETT